MSTVASRIAQVAVQQFHDLFYFYRTLFFALRCAWKIDRKSWVICHDTTTSMPALFAARNTQKIIFDISETPALRGRTTDRFRQKYSLLPNFMEGLSNYAIRRAPLVMCSSTGFAALARERTEHQVVVAISYDGTRPDTLTPPPALMPDPPSTEPTSTGPNPDQADIRHIAWPSTFLKVTGADLALDIVRAWPEAWQLVIIGEITPHHPYFEAITALGPRIRVTGALDRADYLRELAACDGALILFNTELENTRLCVPNRLYDCLAVGVPIVSTPHQAVSQVIERLPDCGEICDAPAPTAFIAPLNRVFEQARPLPPTGEQVMTALDGQSMQAALGQFLPPPGGDNQMVTILANRSIKGRHRITTMVSALHALGYKTRVYAQH
ncbi:MAG: glycosyltransferase [Sulfitobacter sp.]